MTTKELIALLEGCRDNPVALSIENPNDGPAMIIYLDEVEDGKTVLLKGYLDPKSNILSRPAGHFTVKQFINGESRECHGLSWD